MKSIKQTLLLFFIIVVEGYIVLSSELLAIRQSVPYVGSGTDTISIIIAAVLMPMAFGYQNGGTFKPHKIFGHFVTVRKKLIINIVMAATILLIGLSYKSMSLFFTWLPTIGVYDRILQISIYSILFLIVPVYLLGQTVPLITNFFSKQHLPIVTGRILFFSTIGSFIGAVFSTLVLMTFLGVHHTVSLNFVLLAILVIALSKKTASLPVLYTVILALIAMFINSDRVMYDEHIIKNNQYNTIQAGETIGGTREMIINGNRSSSYNDEGRKYSYIEFAERVAIMPIISSVPPKDILVIGAGAFTFGHNDKNNNYTYIDIDRDLKEVAEEYVLREPIGDNKIFIPKPARAFLQESKEKYDLIYLDTYLGGARIPEHLVTKEYFEQVKNHLKDSGILMTNFILSPNFKSKLSRNLDNTFRYVFPHSSRVVIKEQYQLWSENTTQVANVAYIYRHQDNYKKGHIYTDNKNTVFYDKPKKLSP